MMMAVNIRSPSGPAAALSYSQRRVSLSFSTAPVHSRRRLVIAASRGKSGGANKDGGKSGGVNKDGGKSGRVKKDYYLRQISTDFSAEIERELVLRGEGTISECPPDLSPEAVAAAAAASAAASAATKAATYTMAKYMRRENQLTMNANAAKGVIILIYIFLGLVVAFLIDCLKRAFRYVKKVVRSFEKPGVENLTAP